MTTRVADLQSCNICNIMILAIVTELRPKLLYDDSYLSVNKHQLGVCERTVQYSTIWQTESGSRCHLRRQ